MKETYSLRLNGKKLSLEANPEMPLLWVIRDILGLRGTKFGCGAGLCGACTVYLDGSPVRSCQVQISEINASVVTTIEGLEGPVADAIKSAWLDHDVVQCGYCQSGQILVATSLLAENSNPDKSAVDDAMSGNICRCGSYQRMRRAISDASAKLREKS